jgi:hypothetical protein
MGRREHREKKGKGGRGDGEERAQREEGKGR